MKMKYSNIFTILAVTVAIIAAPGCKRANNNQPVYHPYEGTEEAEAAMDENGTYVIFAGSGSTDEVLEVDVNGNVGETFATSVTYDMFTNAGDWEIVPDYSECFYPDASWIVVWPPEGSGDGRFKLTFAPNSGAYAQGDVRTAHVNIISNGRVIKSITANQVGANIVTLDLVATFMSSLKFAAVGSHATTVPIDANVAWSAFVEDPDATWLHITSIEKFSLSIAVDDNYDTEGREATVTVYQLTDVDNTITINVKQVGYTMLTDLVAKASIKCIKGADIEITAKGAQTSDLIEIADTANVDNVVYAPVKEVKEESFVFALPEDLADGSYNLSLVRGSATEFMFNTTIAIVLVSDVVAQPTMELYENGISEIEAVGAQMADEIVFTSTADPSVTFTATMQSVADTSFAFFVPAGIVDGTYQLTLQRGAESLDLFVSQVTVVPAN